MEHKNPSALLSLFAVVVLVCTGSAHGMRLLHDVDAKYGLDFAFGSRATTAGAEAEAMQRDTSLDDYENEISRVEFEPERGTSYAPTFATAADAPAPGPATAGSDAATTTARPGTGSMKWWLPPSTMPSFPLFPNPGGMPGMPMPAMPVPMPMPAGIPGMPAMPMPVPGGGLPGGLPGGGLPGMPLPGGMPAPFNFKPTGWGAGAGGGASTATSPPAQAQPAPPAASSSASDNANDNPSPTESISN